LSRCDKRGPPDGLERAGGVVLSLWWWKDETQLIDIDRETGERGSWRSGFREED
jgi:hypothetical protein